MPNSISNNWSYNANLHKHDFSDCKHLKNKTDDQVNAEFDSEIKQLVDSELKTITDNDKKNPSEFCLRMLKKYTKSQFVSIFENVHSDSEDGQLYIDEYGKKFAIYFYTGWYYDLYHPRLVVYMKLLCALFKIVGFTNFSYKAEEIDDSCSFTIEGRRPV